MNKVQGIGVAFSLLMALIAVVLGGWNYYQKRRNPKTAADARSEIWTAIWDMILWGSIAFIFPQLILLPTGGSALTYFYTFFVNDLLKAILEIVKSIIA